MKKVFYVVLAQLCILAAWQVLAHSGAAGLTVPTPASVIRVYLQPRFRSTALPLRARDRELLQRLASLRALCWEP